MKRVLTSAAVFALMLTGVMQAELITNLSSSTGSAQPGGILTDGSLNLTDRSHVYVNVPGVLKDKAEYVKLSNASDRTANPFTVAFTLTQAADVYLLIDHRIGSHTGYGGDPTTHPADPNLTTKMAWVISNGFVDQGISIAVDEAVNNVPDGTINAYGRLYMKHFAAGSTVTLYEQNDSTNRNMYGVAAVAVTVAPTVIVDDHFNDASIGTNTHGPGSGFNADGPSEKDSAATFTNGSGWDQPRMTSKDGVAIGTDIASFYFLGVSFAKNPTSTHTGSTDRIYLGVKGSSAANSMEGNPDTGFWVQIESDSVATGGGNGSWTGTSTLFYESSTDVSTKLVSWTFDTLNWHDWDATNPNPMNFTPVLDIILDLGPDGYVLTISGDTISNVTGLLSGTYAAAGITNELTMGYAAVFAQSEKPGIDTSIDRIVITETALDNDCPIADLTMDCKVTIEDFAVLAANWLVDTRIMPE